MKYVLASASPRRQELLTLAGVIFDVFPSAVDEKITKDIPSDCVAVGNPAKVSRNIEAKK